MMFEPPTPTAVDAARAIARAHEAFDSEAAAVLGIKRHLGEAFVQAVRLMLMVRGRVVVMGMGKSGHIGRKIVATLSSLSPTLPENASNML